MSGICKRFLRWGLLLFAAVGSGLTGEWERLTPLEFNLSNRPLRPNTRTRAPHYFAKCGSAWHAEDYH